MRNDIKENTQVVAETGESGAGAIYQDSKNLDILSPPPQPSHNDLAAIPCGRDIGADAESRTESRDSATQGDTLVSVPVALLEQAARELEMQAYADELQGLDHHAAHLRLISAKLRKAARRCGGER